jgi:diguanylate cyclase (GGDEF)-like protein
MAFRSIGTRIQTLTGAAFLVGLAGVLTYQTYTRIEATWEERLDANLRIVHGLAGPARGAIARRDKSIVESYMELLTSDPRAAGVVISAGNAVMVSQQSIEHFDLPIADLSRLALEAEASGRTEVLDAADYEYIAVPVKDAAFRTVGSIAVAWSVRGLLDNVWQTAIKEALALIGVVGLVLLVLVFSLRRLVTGPLKRIAALIDRPPDHGTEEAQRAEADFEDRSDEIGTFARALGRFYRNAAEKHRLHGQLDSALTNMSQGLCMFDRDGRLVVSNSRFAEMYGLPPDAFASGLTAREATQRIAGSGLFGADAEDRLREQSEAAFTTHELSDGRTYTISRQPTADGGWVTTHTDVSELRRAEKQLLHLAGHDALTGLPNRRRFRKCIKKVLRQVPVRDAAVLFLDLDRFKAVNDSHGHGAGDELLKTVAAQLLACVEPQDTVCRFGGDEFAILQVSAKQPAGAEALALRIAASLAEPIDIGEHRVRIGVSTGIAIAPRDGEDVGTLLKHADMAVYRAKNEGRNIHRFYTPRMSEGERQRRRLEAALRGALEAGQFEVHYQPMVKLQSDEITCCEALVRWHHPELGLVPPAEFIPVAEDAGLMVPIGEWIIRTACHEAASWPANVRVAVNLSATQFQRGDLAQTVFGALAAAQLAAGRLKCEITESVLLHDEETTLALLHRLRGFGVRIALDEFGTGYSALSCLNKFPFDKIKIDRAFIGSLTLSKASSAIVDAVASISRGLDIVTVAEGVETEIERRLLRAAGIAEMQGHLFSPPRAGDELRRLFFATQQRASA